MTKYAISVINIAIVLFALSSGVLHAEGELVIKPGKYKLTKTTKTNFDSVAATRTTEECITNPDLDPESILPNKENCKINNLKTANNKTSFDFICTEQGKNSTLKGQAEYSTNESSISSNIRLEGLFDGKELIVESSGKGERIGDCLLEPVLDE
ncbi:MAG: DUF3617 domain-containing protein [Candidatus Dadabacteria bacterium]